MHVSWFLSPPAQSSPDVSLSLNCATPASQTASSWIRTAICFNALLSGPTSKKPKITYIKKDAIIALFLEDFVSNGISKFHLSAKLYDLCLEHRFMSTPPEAPVDVHSAGSDGLCSLHRERRFVFTPPGAPVDVHSAGSDDCGSLL